MKSIISLANIKQNLVFNFSAHLAERPCEPLLSLVVITF